MAVAMVTMWMVQMTVDQVVHMIPMGDGFMSAAGAVDVAIGMTAALMVRGAFAGVCGRHRQHMLIHVLLMRMVQMTVMQVVHMAIMLNGGMPAVGPMLVVMIVMLGVVTGAHD